eukprot:PLAT15370.1.p1 GENE.PLAT15370.1~~PLAT15370.1.p1  ORF type:complete len:187 (+),score=37.89 PLAT15370.1:43-603(+)
MKTLVALLIALPAALAAVQAVNMAMPKATAAGTVGSGASSVKRPAGGRITREQAIAAAVAEHESAPPLPRRRARSDGVAGADGFVRIHYNNDNDCLEDCPSGKCRFTGCQTPVACSGGLCLFRSCQAPSCKGGGCTFIQCASPTCSGGGCKFIASSTTLREGFCTGGACTVDGEAVRSNIVEDMAF